MRTRTSNTHQTHTIDLCIGMAAWRPNSVHVCHKGWYPGFWLSIFPTDATVMHYASPFCSSFTKDTSLCSGPTLRIWLPFVYPDAIFVSALWNACSFPIFSKQTALLRRSTLLSYLTTYLLWSTIWCICKTGLFFSHAGVLAYIFQKVSSVFESDSMTDIETILRPLAANNLNYLPLKNY